MRPRSKKPKFSRVKGSWAFTIMAPWALGVGVLVSFTADAGQDSASDWNVAPLTARLRATGDNNLDQPFNFAQAVSGNLGHAPPQDHILTSANLAPSVSDDEDLQETQPQRDLKSELLDFPQVDRSHKSDPFFGVEPKLETASTSLQGHDEASELSFTLGGQHNRPTATALPPRMSLPGDDLLELSEPEVLPATTQKSTTASSPVQSSAKTTWSTEPVKEIKASAPKSVPQKQEASTLAVSDRALHGATPQVARANALSSSTPAQPDATPIEVSSFAGPTLALIKPEKDAKFSYSAWLKPEKLDREKRCLAEAVYFESRSEPEPGQAAVAQVVLNRVQSGLYPASICGVVYQNRHHYKACQFSFACEGRSLKITEPLAWTTAVRVANEVMEGRTYISDVGRSTHYHTNYVRPRWARALTKMDVIGRHIFYKLKPGQT